MEITNKYYYLYEKQSNLRGICRNWENVKEKSCRVTDAYRESKKILKRKTRRTELMWDLSRGNNRQIVVLK